jgi:hypothetical protein
VAILTTIMTTSNNQGRPPLLHALGLPVVVLLLLLFLILPLTNSGSNT